MEAVEVDDKGRLRPSPPASDSGHALTPEEVQDTPALSHRASEEGRQEEQEEEEGEDGGFDPPRREITHMLAPEDACSPSEEHSVVSLSLALHEHDGNGAVERASSSFTFVSPTTSFSANANATSTAASPTSATTDHPEPAILSPPSGVVRRSSEDGE